MQPGFRMHAERTPNPHSIKWVLGQSIAPDGVSGHFDQPVDEDVSPLAARLFAQEGVIGVFFAGNFVTVTKREGVEWLDIAQGLTDAIKAHVESGEPVVGPAFTPAERGPEGDVIGRIRHILEQEVRPAVAMDGGDVVFAGYRDGVVEVHLQGACAGCPSSTATLRFGIEARLREEIPEITKVVSV